MNIIQCQFCRKPFVPLSGKVCPECLEQLDKDFITVRDYIDEHKHANIKKISDDTEVSEQHIVYLIKEGRLIIDNPAGDGGGLIVCEMCGVSIPTGRLCNDCSKSLSKNIGGKASAPKEKPAQKPQQNFKASAKIR